MDLVCSQQSLIQPDQMRIVLESEAASVYCQFKGLGEDILSKDSFKEKIENTGFKFMVIDLGGNSAVLYIYFK